MIKLDGLPYAVGTAFTRNGNSYPGNWYQNATAGERLDMGFTEVADPEPYDQRYYYGYDAEGNLLPRPVAECGAVIVAEAKATAYAIIAKNYDWRVMKALMEGVAIPSDVTTGAAAIRTCCNDIEDAVAEATTVEELIAIDKSFPEV